MPVRSARCLLALTAVLGAAVPALAQANFVETFDSAGDVAGGQSGPSGLMASGWTFRRTASPLGAGTWYTFGGGWAYEGAGCLDINGTITQVNGAGSAWAILPAIPGQQAGDPRANFNGSGSLSAQDIFDFLAAWFAGC